jgi:hypothetical protein
MSSPAGHQGDQGNPTPGINFCFEMDMSCANDKFNCLIANEFLCWIGQSSLRMQHIAIPSFFSEIRPLETINPCFQKVVPY